MWKLVIIYTVVLLLGSGVASLFNLPIWIALIFLLVAVVIMLGDFIYTNYRTTNMKKVAKMVTERKKEPIYSFIYAQSFGTIEDQLRAIDLILKKYRQPYMQHYYQWLRAIINQDLELALEEAEKIEKEPLASYSKAYVQAMLGNSEKALSYPLQSKWMQEAILAISAINENDDEAFEQYSNNSISAARGVQRFSLIHVFKSMRTYQAQEK